MLNLFAAAPSMNVFASADILSEFGTASAAIDVTADEIRRRVPTLTAGQMDRFIQFMNRSVDVDKMSKRC